MYLLLKNAGMPDGPASGHSGTGMKKRDEAVTSTVLEYGDPVRYRNDPVRDWDFECRIADADGIGLPILQILQIQNNQKL